MSKWFLEVVQDHDGTYYANMLVEGRPVKGLPEYVDYNTLRDAIRLKTGVEILKRIDMNFQEKDRKKYAYIDATQIREDCRVTLQEIENGWRPDFTSIRDLREGDRIQISGDSANLWLSDYNVRVDTEGTVLETPASNDKKVFVSIDSIDGEQNVYAYVRKSHIILLSPDLSQHRPRLNETLQEAKARASIHSASPDTPASRANQMR